MDNYDVRQRIEQITSEYIYKDDVVVLTDEDMFNRILIASDQLRIGSTKNDSGTSVIDFYGEYGQTKLN
ncbi:hypothetical protein DS745_22290 [Anaerobacillus alkaliphilus]|uniref:Uncharacterized protein n=1 Tax=Anaerobacillus alkaliphilus TaxID=1548597 RepID=A0A4Q0VN21_9BACI|nr:hypothetical protein [Anaerobacillus alkaliphilus]RXI96444.1 hypothetical protein DS745_22290 [Anaerobacillus alkaliphilus]